MPILPLWETRNHFVAVIILEAALTLFQI
jgi:hypothetical protein